MLHRQKISRGGENKKAGNNGELSGKEGVHYATVKLVRPAPVQRVRTDAVAIPMDMRAGDG